MCIRDSENVDGFQGPLEVRQFKGGQSNPTFQLVTPGRAYVCLLYTSDAADERSSVDLGGRRIIKKKKKKTLQGAST